VVQFSVSEVVQFSMSLDNNLRTPDALQAASCLQLGPDAVMVTGDPGFQRVPALRLALVNGAEGGG